MNAQSFYRKPLPNECIPFESEEGKQVFKDAMNAGNMEGYFPLASQFHTQSDPAFCGLGTLTMVLNALSVDPEIVWKGIWRWYSESLLDCCLPLDVIQKKGITFQEFKCLAKCNGLQVDSYYGSDSDVETFRAKVKETTSLSGSQIMVVSYDRSTLGQTGSGHYSPIGGYHPTRDLVLILDVARFKYPPHWVPLPLLFKATLPVDAETNKSRGFFVLTNGGAKALWCRLKSNAKLNWSFITKELCERMPKLLRQQNPTSTHDIVLALFKLMEGSEEDTVNEASLSKEGETNKTVTNDNNSTKFNLIEAFSSYRDDIKGKLSQNHTEYLDEMQNELHRTQMYKLVKEVWQTLPSLAMMNDQQIDLVTIVILSCPLQFFKISPNSDIVKKTCHSKSIDFRPVLTDENLIEEWTKLYQISEGTTLSKELSVLRQSIAEICQLSLGGCCL